MDRESSAFIASPPLVQAICACATRIDCSHDRELFHQGDEPTSLYVLERGHATMTLEADNGVPIVRRTVGPGSLLGLPALIGNVPYSLTAVAESGAQVSVVARHVFSRLMLSEPALAMMILQVLAAEVHSARAVISDRETHPHRERALRH
jgi:CRP-like cAMP-binding protein